MFKPFSPKRAKRTLERYDSWIQTVSARYGVPAAVVKAILYREMVQIDLVDYAADLAVGSGLFRKKDSSTGYAQIYGYVGVNAANFAVDRGLATYESLGIESDHRLDPDNLEDARLVWKKLHASKEANIELATLNLLAAAYEVVGHGDFDRMSDEELKLVMTRYNANVRHVTEYGERAFATYKAFLNGEM